MGAVLGSRGPPDASSNWKLTRTTTDPEMRDIVTQRAHKDPEEAHFQAGRPVGKQMRPRQPQSRNAETQWP